MANVIDVVKLVLCEYRAEFHGKHYKFFHREGHGVTIFRSEMPSFIPPSTFKLKVVNDNIQFVHLFKDEGVDMVFETLDKAFDWINNNA